MHLVSVRCAVVLLLLHYYLFPQVSRKHQFVPALGGTNGLASALNFNPERGLCCGGARF